jgi:hypothetical protein
MTAKGTFDVDLKPLKPYASSINETSLNRMSIDKTFSGDLQATSKGEMLSARSPVKGSAGYVAIEQVEGSLSDKSGSFVLQHFGTMTGGDQRLILEVVPDTGTGELTGITGTMTIEISDGQHFYKFDYEL